jgi:hypothetical protein
MKYEKGQRVLVKDWNETGVIEDVDYTFFDHAMHENLWLHVRLPTGQSLIVRAHDVKVID